MPVIQECVYKVTGNYRLHIKSSKFRNLFLTTSCHDKSSVKIIIIFLQYFHFFLFLIQGHTGHTEIWAVACIKMSDVCLCYMSDQYKCVLLIDYLKSDNFLMMIYTFRFILQQGEISSYMFQIRTSLCVLFYIVFCG